jgi:hypothetical protein
MSQYKIRKDGTLSPIGLDPRVQSNLAWGEEYGYLAFTKDGRYLYATTGMSQSLDQFEVNNDGTLSLLSTSEYGWEFDMCCGLAHVVLDPSDQVLLTINQTARSSIVFTLNGSHRPISSPSQYNKLTRDNKRFVSLEELRKSVKENLPKVTYKDKTPTSAELCAEINAEIAAVDALIAVPITAEYGPKDTLYVVSTSEVARFKLMPDGSTKGEPSALDWPDLRKRKKADNTAGTESAADDRFPTGLTFLYR